MAPALWAEYAAARPEVAATPAAEAAAALQRNGAAVARDARAWGALPSGASEAAYDEALRRVAVELLRLGEEQAAEAEKAEAEKAVAEAVVETEEVEAEELEAEAEAEKVEAEDVEAEAEAEAQLHVDALVAYLDERMCVPRDMGGPAAAAVRALHRHRRRNGRTVAEPSVVRVNRF